MDMMEKFTKLEKRVSVLEKALNITGRHDEEVLEMDLVLPEADIDGLHFNETKVHAVFDLKEDGNYYSRDILFMSARDTDEGTGRDLLTEYLESEAVREAFLAALGDRNAHTNKLRVFLPEKNQGVKKYNGVTWRYWLRSPYSGTSNAFCSVYASGAATHYYDSLASGVAPAFCVR
jgi:hypothetical protein